VNETICLLGVSGSPREGGNSTFLMNQALKTAESFEGVCVKVEKIDFSAKKVSPCIACYGCINAKGECVIKDDFQAMRDAWLRADAILYSIPVFVMTIPGQLKCFLDRLTNSLVFNKEVSRKKLKVVGTVAQGMHFAAGQEGAIREIANISMLLGCLPLAGESYNGVRGWTYEKLSRSTYMKRLDAGDEITKRLIQEAQGLVTDLLTVALILRSGARACRDKLGKCPNYASFFQRLEEES